MTHSQAGPADSVFYASNQPGFSTAVSTHPARVLARKRIGEVRVRFASELCTVQTPEGVVYARPGDAIVVGPTGDQWAVPAKYFEEKYQAVPPTAQGEAGRYVNHPNSIMAVQMSGPFEVLLADGVSRLKGQAGDWLVDYGDGSLGIVAQAIFAATYQVVG